ncbi:melanopsin-like [Actinia tenebrosa]|uniref:Melanopsin-like n=1 Tax=Actinia tenebrosa TaxID=6105 RepID=A0A6P8HEG6_ACTTE|nr:melanopsin-like [Actinia tenebrosa]XP_031554118.1 melanopsin-like [Actinia tenebrosa]
MNNTSSYNKVQEPLKPRSSVELITLSLSLALIIALSVFGNLLLILSIFKNERLRASFANKLILSLAIADFLTASFPMSYQLATVVNVNIISNGGVVCTIGGLATYSFFFTSTFTMIMLCIDRFVALGYPLHYNLRITSRVKIFMIAYPWVHGSLFAILCGSLLDINFDPKGLDCGLGWHKRPMAFTLSVLMIHVGMPFVLLLVLNTRTLFLVRAQNRQILHYDKKGMTDKSGVINIRAKDAYRKRAKIEFKLAKVSITIVFVFLVCWTPYVVTRSLVFMGLKLSTGILSAGAWVVHASSFANPLIYSSLRVDLRQAMRNVFLRHKVRQSNASVIELENFTAKRAGEQLSASFDSAHKRSPHATKLMLGLDN